MTHRAAHRVPAIPPPQGMMLIGTEYPGGLDTAASTWLTGLLYTISTRGSSAPRMARRTLGGRGSRDVAQKCATPATKALSCAIQSKGQGVQGLRAT
eukprot:CAMPEP_0182855112 /NCGR_PEP_ID=MMETSP0034_2-20130328/1651_1 /TAXON_ID=156128 /ORGANISM="Nephroselmis pyriformis, Strain CCMP717" /LENGTH=96 /DNA_ID=CAMNT_0024986033 /DNA_START=1597 /DNA_END=1883 /DNA_ORIENTATION=+